jgi:glycosyltransferase involved in cell wall biosynthesis
MVSASLRQGMTTDTRQVSGAAAVTAMVSAARICIVHVCLVYDCLYPYTVGGAERWYRNLAERIASSGHQVTFLTRRQWERGSEPSVRGVDVVAVAPRMRLYVGGRRRILPPLLFGLGVLGHLLRRGSRYDVVHTASFPYFSLLAAGAARRSGGFRLVVDWHEIWTREYWRAYLGPIAGLVGWGVQRACLRVPQQAFCFSRLHERRLRELGLRGELTRLEGQYAGPLAVAGQQRAPRSVAVFAGRHIPEKRVPALVPALAEARRQIPDLRGEIYGDGPDRENVLRAIAATGLDGRVVAPGFVDADVLEEAVSTALCLVLPSKREGYGLVVVEAAARGVPVVVVEGADNAATELVEEGVNGAVAPSVEPRDLAAAIVRVHHAGPPLRESAAEWFRRNAQRLSIDGSIERVLAAYAGA